MLERGSDAGWPLKPCSRGWGANSLSQHSQYTVAIFNPSLSGARRELDGDGLPTASDTDVIMADLMPPEGGSSAHLTREKRWKISSVFEEIFNHCFPEDIKSIS